ncbi:2-C-methyl-D-erythritol 4-phosphate cytidylyltransferase [Clostridium sp. DJ247]|uniref:2-C-methyl-D-erythritol 4-phosphate cytidylyltransferase n=1 Tax=Clostridium sp. DJ247 TaxID=2726188 RepID=UPI001624A59E|nr:2-C-methyl-D-erythritol 4-phosphate cytidylyltransferase [Clostridium sp. DJ247]MBC2582529.1 2-C-methyl-D-erythritol 4-phosphate cytidylyltransferase [Clostridium sp. DJ247]
MGKNYAVIVAAGKGKRMRANINKQFINIKNKPMLYYTLSVFSNNSLIDGIILVCSENEVDFCRVHIVEKYNIGKVLSIVSGGKERQESVYNGLKAIKECDIVLIHDGARPFVTDALIEDGIKYAKIYGACACGVTPKDTIKVKNEQGFSCTTPDRNTLFSVQTPQCFQYDLIFNCHKKLSSQGINVTDDTTVVEYYGNKVYLYQGSYENIKVTTPEDLNIAEIIVENKR